MTFSHLTVLIAVYCIAGVARGWPAGPPSVWGGRPLLPPLPSPSSMPCHGGKTSSSNENVGHELFLPQEEQLLTRRSPSSICGGHGKCSLHTQECVCDPCWAGQACVEYVDLHQPRFLVNNLYRVITKDVKGALFRAEVTDDDLGLTCPLHGPGEATTCPCATVRFTLAPGGHAALFSVDNETGDVFLVAGTTLLPGNEYHLTLEAHGLRVAGWRGQRPGHDVMRAVVYVSHEPPLESLLLASVSEAEQASASWPRQDKQRRRKRQVKQGIAVDLFRINPNLGEPLIYGTALQYKVLLRLPSGSWSQEVELVISSDNEEGSTLAPLLALCNPRVTHHTHAMHSSRGPLVELQPRLLAHAQFSSMYVEAVFNFGTISIQEKEEIIENNTLSNDTNVGANIEIMFEAIICNTSSSVTSLAGGSASPISELQYIRASLANGEAGAQAAVNISAALTLPKSPEQGLSVMEGKVNSPLEISWAVTPHLVSSDLAIQVHDVTPGPAQFRIGGLRFSTDDGFHCLAAPKAILTSIKCLLTKDKSISRLLAKLYIPVYTKRTDATNKDAVITLKAWLIPFNTQSSTTKNITIEAVISSGNSRWSSKQNMIFNEDEMTSKKVEEVSTTSSPTITVTSLSTSNVPRGPPVLSEIALHLPKGMFNLTIIVSSKTKGVKPISISMLDAKASVDQAALQHSQVLQPDETKLIFKPSQLVLNTMETERSVVMQVAFAADDTAADGAAQTLITVVDIPSPVPLTFTVLPTQAPIITPEISVVPYEDERAFDEQSLLGFGIMLEMPGGCCTKAIRVEVSGRYTGYGDGEPALCATEFTSVDQGLPALTISAVNNAGDAGAVRDLGSVCSATLLDSTAHQSATYRVIFHLTSPTNSTLDGEIRMSGRVWLGGSALWSGGVAVRVHRVANVNTKVTCPPRVDECLP